MVRIPRPGARRSRRSARLTLALGAALLTMSLATGPVGATVILQGHYSDDYTFSFDDCGFWIDGAGHVDGVAHVRVGKGDLLTAFFGHDRSTFRETWTRRDTGTSVVVGGSALFQETKAIHIEGTVFQFTSVLAGQPFTVWDSDGNVVVRDRGVVRQVLQFDTLGDSTPGGEFVAEVSFEFHGPHPGIDLDMCTLFE